MYLALNSANACTRIIDCYSDNKTIDLKSNVCLIRMFNSFCKTK